MANVPEPVVNGFTIGIAVIIATSPLKDLFGLTAAQVPAGFVGKLEALWGARDSVNGPALAVGLATMVLIVLLRRLAPKFPGLIVADGLTSAVVALPSITVDTLYSRFGALPGMLPVPAMPDLSPARIVELLPSAFVIAFLASIESLISAMVADRMIGGHHRPNAEILAQGFANIGSSLFGGHRAHRHECPGRGRTPVAGIVHALAILLVMLIAASVAGYLAMPALAGLLILTAWNMSEPHKWRGYLRERPSDRFLLVLTMILTVFADLTVAIGVGVALGLALRLRRRNVPPCDWSTPDR